MKMENVLRAEIDGTVKKINAKPGDSLAVDSVILEFAGPDAALRLERHWIAGTSRLGRRWFPTL